MDIDERRVRLEAKRSETALNVLRSMGFSPEYDSSEKVVTFVHGGNTIRYFPFTGWATGKGIRDGRGFVNLVRQLTK